MAEKLEANQYASYDEPPPHAYVRSPQNPYASRAFREAARHICLVCQLPKDHAVHDDRELVTA